MSIRPNSNSSDSDGDCNQESGRASGWVGWTLGLLAVPVVYVLTYPPVVILSYKLGASWMRVYCVPYGWVADHTPLHAPLQWYVEWWVSITGFLAP